MSITQSFDGYGSANYSYILATLQKQRVSYECKVYTLYGFLKLLLISGYVLVDSNSSKSI